MDVIQVTCDSWGLPAPGVFRRVPAAPLLPLLRRQPPPPDHLHRASWLHRAGWNGRRS